MMPGITWLRSFSHCCALTAAARFGQWRLNCYCDRWDIRGTSGYCEGIRYHDPWRGRYGLQRGNPFFNRRTSGERPKKACDPVTVTVDNKTCLNDNGDNQNCLNQGSGGNGG